MDRRFDRDGPNGSRQAKLRQLDLFDALHKLFENKELPPCMLSYNLKKTVEARRKLREGLENPTPPGSVQYRLPVRLARFAPNTALLTDRGYTKFAHLYPNLNAHITPTFLEGRAQFDYEDMQRDVPIKKLRYTSEVVFSRMQQTKLLQGTIKFNDYVVFDSVISYAAGLSNLTMPLREPRDWKNYFENRGN
jgi:hypothetical protein